MVQELELLGLGQRQQGRRIAKLWQPWEGPGGGPSVGQADEFAQGMPLRHDGLQALLKAVLKAPSRLPRRHVKQGRWQREGAQQAPWGNDARLGRRERRRAAHELRPYTARGLPVLTCYKY